MVAYSIPANFGLTNKRGRGALNDLTFTISKKDIKKIQKRMKDFDTRVQNKEFRNIVKKHTITMTKEIKSNTPIAKKEYKYGTKTVKNKKKKGDLKRSIHYKVKTKRNFGIYSVFGARWIEGRTNKQKQPAIYMWLVEFGKDGKYKNSFARRSYKAKEGSVRAGFIKDIKNSFIRAKEFKRT